LAILLGSLGVHKFVLGYNNEGFIILIATVIGYATLCLFVGAFILTATSLLGLIEGIVYLTKTDVEFHEIYQKNKKPWL
jgi:TM2 domain-containing membrane protein YozV